MTELGEEASKFSQRWEIQIFSSPGFLATIQQMEDRLDKIQGSMTLLLLADLHMHLYLMILWYETRIKKIEEENMIVFVNVFISYTKKYDKKQKRQMQDKNNNMMNHLEYYL